MRLARIFNGHQAGGSHDVGTQTCVHAWDSTLHRRLNPDGLSFRAAFRGPQQTRVWFAGAEPRGILVLLKNRDPSLHLRLRSGLGLALLSLG